MKKKQKKKKEQRKPPHERNPPTRASPRSPPKGGLGGLPWEFPHTIHTIPYYTTPYHTTPPHTIPYHPSKAPIVNRTNSQVPIVNRTNSGTTSPRAACFSFFFSPFFYLLFCPVSLPLSSLFRPQLLFMLSLFTCSSPFFSHSNSNN